MDCQVFVVDYTQVQIKLSRIIESLESRLFHAMFWASRAIAVEDD